MKKEELLDIARDCLLYVTDRDPLVMHRGAGMYLWDTTGKRYLDFLGGWAVNSLGHSPELIRRVLAEQAATLVNASPSFLNEPMLRFAKLLTGMTCMDRVFFCSTGAEANESAIKLARKYGAVSRGGAYEIITTDHGFHGRTLATMAASGKAAWAQLFEPKVPGFIKVPFNDISAIRSALTGKTCAAMIEPTQGEGGVHPAGRNYLSDLRSLCADEGILLILDEVQTGLGRTGTMFAYEQYDIEPDILTLGKGLGGGFPVAAMLAKERLNIFRKGEQGGTYTGQPLAMAVGEAVVSAIRDRALADNARNMGELILRELRTLSADFPLRDIRGRGLLLAFDLDRPVAEALRVAALARGLIINAPGPETIRLVPALIVEEAHVQEMIGLLRAALAELYPQT